MHIVYVSDGKAGHRSQAVGLFKAMQRQSAESVTFEEISIETLSIFSLITLILKRQTSFLIQKPDYILGVGSHTQLRVLLLKKIYVQAKTVILMKPNFPSSWFDACIIPQHDGVVDSKYVVNTQGALNPIVNEFRHESDRILLALGGSSKRHKWNDNKVLTAIQSIVENNAQSQIVLTTSRRTPVHFLQQLRLQSYIQQVKIYPVEDTPQGWIFEEMQKSEAVWITEDSVSMIYEALTAGCKVGVILIDRLKADRITNSIDQMLQQKQVSTTSKISELNQANRFAEADRIASLLLNK